MKSHRGRKQRECWEDREYIILTLSLSLSVGPHRNRDTCKVVCRLDVEQ